jgi:hypothetical protein
MTLDMIISLILIRLFAVSFCHDKSNEVHVYKLGTDSFRKIQDLPYYGSISGPGVFARGTINWLACVSLSSFSHNIVSYYTIKLIRILSMKMILACRTSYIMMQYKRLVM